jgi:hypothetical protein
MSQEIRRYKVGTKITIRYLRYSIIYETPLALGAGEDSIEISGVSLVARYFSLDRGTEVWRSVIVDLSSHFTPPFFH